MATLIRTADRLHGWATAQRWLRRFTWTVRVLLALGFIPSGLRKVVNQPFTGLDPETNPIGRFFDVLQQAGFLYEFIGWAQEPNRTPA